MPSMTDRRAELSAIAIAFHNLRMHIEEIGVETLAFLIAQAMEEARAVASDRDGGQVIQMSSPRRSSGEVDKAVAPRGLGGFSHQSSLA